VPDHLDARIPDGERPLDGAVPRGVVDDEHAVDERRDPRERLLDQPLLVERGDDDRDGLALDHGRR
jgi:hypothetical protein